MAVSRNQLLSLRRHVALEQDVTQTLDPTSISTRTERLPPTPVNATTSSASLAGAAGLIVTERETAATITGLKTFDLDPAAPFAVTASSAVVPNLDADKIDGIEGAEILQRNGSVALTADWDVGAFKVTAETIESDVATGTAPLVIASTTEVANLNAATVGGAAYSTGTFTITGTGFTVNPTGTARYVKMGSMVTLFIPTLTGTDNAATFTLTGIPAAIQATRNQNGFAIEVVDNTGARAAPGALNIKSGATAWDLFIDFAAGVWPGSGTKTLVDATVTYTLE